jgi:hypothetical protein
MISLHYIFFIFTCIIPRGAPFAGGAPLLGGDGPPCGGPGGAPAAGGGGAALFSGAGGPAPVKGLSHEIDFNKFDKNLQNLACNTQDETTMYCTDKSVKKTVKLMSITPKSCFILL